jgi:thiamine-phosphate pyrophosphorylase
VSLDRLLVLSDRAMSAGAGLGLVATVTEAVAGGARAIVLREKDLPADERVALAGVLTAVLEPAGGTLIVASDPAVASAAGATWLHLAAVDPVPSSEFRWGRSCHSADDVARAAAEGASYVTVSPVFATASKPGYGPALGSAGLRAVVTAVEGTRMPVFALGGVTPERVPACVDAGAYGVAVMGEVMRSRDPAGAVKALLA